MRKALLLLVVLATFVAGCDNKYKDPDPQAMGYDYYPIEIGDYRVYNVTDIKFRENRGDTSRFQLRERVDTSFHDQTGQLVYKVVRSIRPNDRSDWLDDSVMVVAKTETMVLQTKNNIKRVKMIFPVKEGKKWAGDAFNSSSIDTTRNLLQNKEHYFYQNVNQSYSLNGVMYPNTASIIQGDSYTYNYLDDRKEVYAKELGLLYRLFKRFEYCKDSESRTCPIVENYIVEGHERHEILIDHGKL